MGATNFKKARKNLRLTQKQVAEKIGITENSYARIERGDAKPSYDTLKAICRVLKLELPFKT
jgi:transcriptional regulator with XRE-family HTH domain